MIGDDGIHPVDVAVIGGGQAGLAAAGQLRRRGLRPLDAPDAEDRSRPAGRFVVLDANPRPGGAWQHRWPGLTMATVNNITDLPGMPLRASSPDAESRVEVPAYFAAYEQAMGLRVRRPVSVASVARGNGDRLLVHSDRGVWAARFVINATGTWTQPIRPVYPGQETFAGRGRHAGD